MTRIRRILCASDFSKTSGKALISAIHLAKANRADQGDDKGKRPVETRRGQWIWKRAIREFEDRALGSVKPDETQCHRRPRDAGPHDEKHQGQDTANRWAVHDLALSYQDAATPRRFRCGILMTVS